MSAGRGVALLLAGLLVVAAIAVLVHRSQGADDQQAAAYRAAADAACQKVLTQIEVLTPRTPATTTEVETLIRLSVPLVDEFDRTLHRLRPSDDQRPAHRELLLATDEQLRALKRAGYEIEMNEVGPAIADWRSVAPAGRRSDAAARDPRLKICPNAPRQLTPDVARTRQLARIRRKAEAWLQEGHYGPPFKAAPDGTQPRRGPRLPGSYLYLVPMDDVPMATVKQLAQDVEVYLDSAGFRARIMSRLFTESHLFDASRQQIKSDKLLDQLIAVYPFSPDVKAVGVVGITNGDLYFSTSADRFVLGIRDVTRNGNGGWGIVSTARLDPRNQGVLPDQDLYRLRLKKMAARYIGMFMFRAQLPSDRANSLFQPTVPSVDTLDAMTDRFCEDRPFPVASGPC